jgi:very-short-patch-repair endonuclease
MAETPTDPSKPEQGMCAAAIADREILGRKLLAAEPGRVRLIGGIGTIEARARLDALAVPEDGPLALLLPLERIAPADGLIEDLARHLARVASRCFPVWYDHADFSGLKRDTLGKNAVRMKLVEVAHAWPRLSQEWARAAVALAQDRRPPRPARVHWSIEIIQLCLAIRPSGLVIVLDAKDLPAPEEAHALVHALELVAAKALLAVVVLSSRLPEFVPPYARVLDGALSVRPSHPPHGRAVVDADEDDALEAVGLVPVTGRPHPLSEVEKRVAQAIAAAPDLAALFRCNQVVETVRGSRPRVDLLWREGRLVVELDGYADHARRDIFMGDRHRDYELTLSGYTVLRLANDEVHQDVEKAIDKIRDVVTFLSTKSARSI